MLSLKDIVIKIKLALDPGARAIFVNDGQKALNDASNPGKFSDNMDQAGKAVNTLDGYLKRLAARILLVFSARLIAQFVTDCVDQFAKFDKALQSSVAIMDGVDSVMREKLANTARKVAIELNLAADDVAKGYYELASAGLDAQASIKALPIVATFAKAGLVDLAEATQLLTTANSALGYSSKDAATNTAGMIRIANVLTKANNEANGTIKDFAEALTNKAGQALRVMHKDVEEGAAALMVLAKQGIMGATAGERLTIFLNQLNNAASNNAKTWRDYGIQVFDSQGKMLNLATVVDNLTNGLGRLSPEQQAIAMKQLGIQVRTMGVVKAFMDQGDAMREYQKQLENAGGATQKVADNQMKTFAERWGQIKTRINDAKISIGEALVPALEKAGGVIGDEGGGLVFALRQFAEWIKQNQDGIGSLIKGSLTLLIGTLQTLYYLFNSTGNVIVWLTSAVLLPLSLGFQIVLLPVYLLIRSLQTLASIITPDKWNITGFLKEMGDGIADVTKKTSDFQKHLIDISKNSWQDQLSMDPSKGSKPPKEKSLVDEAWKNGGAGSSQSNADGVGTDDALPGKGKKGSKRDPRAEALDQLNAMLAGMTNTPEDDMNAKIDRIERKFKDAYNGTIPESIQASIAKLREFAKETATLDSYSDKIKLLDKKEGSVDNIIELQMMEAALKDQAAQIDKNSTLYQKYQELIKQVGDAITNVNNKISAQQDKIAKDKVEALEKEKQHWEQLGRRYIYPVVDRTISMFEKLFRVMTSGGNRIANVYKAMKNAVLEMLIGGFSAFFKKKAEENALSAAENFAKAWGDFGDGNTGAAAAHLKAGGEHLAVAAGWAALAGAAGSAAPSSSGGAGGGDVGGKTASNSTTQNGDINIYIDGVDPKNPRHQQLIGDTAREYQERYGKDVFVKPGRV